MHNYSVAVVGVTGYSGREVDRLLKSHPSIHVNGRFTSKGDGSSIQAYSLAAVKQSQPDVVITATEHEVSLRIVSELVAEGFRVIDMSGAFRMKDTALYPKWYGFEHTATDLLQQVVYGMPEMFADKIRTAQVVANPGCYATSVILPLSPLYAAGVISPKSLLVVDGKSGVSGAGRHPKLETHFCEVNENLRAYAVLRHRHTPEMLAYLPQALSENFVFTPHLIPITRGILSTIVFQHAEGSSARSVLTTAYANAPFVKIMPEGMLPDIHGVVHTNDCQIGIATSGKTTVIVSAIDNLVKGAAGQAIQNLNLMLGYEEETGLHPRLSQ
jgi:N-acetyl-gamma-glutamyl-phosphate reductase